MIPSRSRIEMSACWSASSQTLNVRCTKSLTSVANSAWVILRSSERVSPSSPTNTSGIRTSTSSSTESPFLAASAANLELFEGKGIIAGVDTFLGDEFVGQQIEDTIVEIIAAQERIAAGGEHFENILADLEYGDIERASAEIVHRNALLETLAESICQCRRCGFVEDAEHLESRDESRVLRGLSLIVVEVGRYGDDGLRDLGIQAGFGDLLHLAQHHRRDLGQRELFVADPDPDAVIGPFEDLVGIDDLGLANLFGEVIPADQALGRGNGMNGIVDDIGPGRVAHRDRSVLVKRDHAGGRILTKGVRQHLDFVAVPDRDARVAGSEINSHSQIRHELSPLPSGPREPDHLCIEVFSISSVGLPRPMGHRTFTGEYRSDEEIF